MINNSNQANIPLFTWQALLWRLLLTVLLLLALAGPGLTLFRHVTSRAGARALPALHQPIETGELKAENSR
jgi:hypothetical protein